MGVALLKICVSVEVGFEDIVAKATKVCNTQLLMSPAYHDVELSALSQHHVCRHTAIAIHHDNGSKFSSARQLQINAFLYKCCCGHGVSSQQQQP